MSRKQQQQPIATFLGHQRKMKCLECRRIPDYYMVHDSVWDPVTRRTKGKGQLCFTCLEKRAKRKLTLKDLLPCPASGEHYFGLLVTRRWALRRRCTVKQMREYAVKTCVYQSRRESHMKPSRYLDILRDPSLNRCYDYYMMKLQ
jgi:hypothetical protein